MCELQAVEHHHPLQARKLEGELDAKVAAYGKLCSSYDTNISGKRGEGGLATEQVCTRGNDGEVYTTTSPTQLIQVKAADVEALLGRLSDINDAMSGAVSGVNDARTHTLARHRDILHDFNQVGHCHHTKQPAHTINRSFDA